MSRWLGASRRKSAEANTHAATGLELAVVHDSAGLSALGPEWRDLFQRSGTGGHVFQTHAWCLTWAEVFLPRRAGDFWSRELFIMTGRRNGRLVMVWPMVRETAFGLTRLVWLGGPVSQYGDVLLDAEAAGPDAIWAAWRYIVANAKADLVIAGKVRRDGTAFRVFETIGAVPAVVARAPYCDLSAATDFEGYATKFPKKARKNQKRKDRRFSEAGQESFVRSTGGADTVVLAGEVMRLKRDWLRKTGRVSRAILDPRTDRFFRTIARADRATEAGTQVTALRVDGDLAAAEIAFTCEASVAVHVIAYDQRFQGLSAGQILLQRSISDHIARGTERFDFMAPADGYKLEWADDAVDVVDWAVPLSSLGRAYVFGYLSRMRPLLKEVQARGPLVVRRAMASLFQTATGRG